MKIHSTRGSFLAMSEQAAHGGKTAEAEASEKPYELPATAPPIAYGQPQPGVQPPGYAPQPGVQPPGYAPQPGVQPPGYAPQPGVQPSGYVPQPGVQPPGYAPQPGVQPPGYAPQPGVQQQGYPQPGAYPPPAGYQYPPPPPGGYQYPQPGGYQAPMVQQPAQEMWMMVPQGIPNCPPGLEYLTIIDQLLVQQKVELLEAFTGFETNNKYAIRNSMGQHIYMATEDTDFCTRNCCGPLRPFDMKIMDNAQNEIIHLNRPLACQGCCCPCCLQSIDVFAPPGQFIGRVKQNWSCWTPKFSIENAAGDAILKIEGPCCTVGMCGDVEFKVMALDGTTQVGKISKQWTGFAKEYLTDADNFGITFPMDLDVRMKAVMLGTVFLIDFMFFEQSNNQNRR